MTGQSSAVEVLIPPFTRHDQLLSDDTSIALCQALVPLLKGPSTLAHTNDLTSYLSQELATPTLNELSCHLWLFTKYSSGHIDPLHVHRTKRRQIIPVEDPNLHLVWHRDVVYVKPVPGYLLNNTFWSTNLTPNHQQGHDQTKFSVDKLSPACRAALGLLRSYSLLIRHPSDFELAVETHLVPRGLTFVQFRQFLAPFRLIPDEAVALRYHYGQLRLSRLNWAVRLLRPSTTGRLVPWAYHSRHWYTGEFFAEYGPSLLAMFATLSVALSAMQVALAAQDGNVTIALLRACWGFSVTVMVVSALTIGGVLVGLVSVYFVQFQFALRQRRKE